METDDGKEKGATTPIKGGGAVAKVTRGVNLLR
jgi:hypothetical protein